MNLCLNCRRRLRTCVCSLIKSFQTETRFIILMHPMEYKKEKVGTGRFTHLILKNSHLFVGVSFDEDKEFQKLLHEKDFESFLLYPGDDAIDLSGKVPLTFLNKKRKQVIVIDGTWQCAKKMMKLTSSLHGLPRISFSSQRVSEFKIKHQPLPGCLSTVESIHQVIMELNNLGIENTEGAESCLIEVFNYTVEQQLALAENPEIKGYRKKPHRLPSERQTSKKWEKRLLYFREES